MVADTQGPSLIVGRTKTADVKPGNSFDACNNSFSAALKATSRWGETRCRITAIPGGGDCPSTSTMVGTLVTTPYFSPADSSERRSSESSHT